MNDRIDTAQWHRLGMLFEQAIGLDAAGREELLRTIEGEDPELSQALASLLDADARHRDRTVEHRARLLQDSLDGAGSGLAVGDRVGPYVLRESLGEGGMGVVFRAERADGQVRQEVALKVVKLGLDARELIARFEAERQALALMEHPHIARMLDAGTTDGGRPYFVMELVRGEPIWRYCTMHGLTVVQRLQLFGQVCAAVQHAHTKGIIHRDLKPNNVLVSTQDGQPCAKVIDFGIAKATQGRLTDKTLLTERFLMMGTPLYMSPEQAAGSEDIDTRTDIYALGVILYELLTDTTPIDSNSLRQATFDEVRRIIREVDPPRPSVRLSQSATTRGRTATASQESALRVDPKALRGELDWIVMKALEKDRARRYESASALAEDIRRYLVGEAVLAAPPSAAYRIRKLIRRHKGAFAAGSMVAAALLAGILAFAWQARIARQQAQLAHQQARLAQQRAKEVEQVAKFEGDMLKQVDSNRAGRELVDDMQAKLAAALIKAGVPESEREAQAATFAGLLRRLNATDTAVGVIDRTTMRPAVAAIGQQFKDQPVVAARLQQVLADRYVQMGLYEEAMPLQKSALATRRHVLGDNDRDTLHSIEDMGELIRFEQRWSDAEVFLREALEKRRRVLGEEDPETVQSKADLGELLLIQNKMAEAEPYLRQGLASSRRVNGEDSSETIDLLGYMGILKIDQGKLGEAEQYLREAVQKSRRIGSGERLRKFEFIVNMGWVLWQEGKMDEAEPYLRESLEMGRRVQGEEHPDTVYKINIMGAFLEAQGKHSQAEPYFRETLEKSRRIWGEENSFTLLAMTRLGRNLEAQGKLGEAETCLREALQTSRRALPENDQTLLFALAAMGNLLLDQGKLSLAEPYLREAWGKVRPGGPWDRMAMFANAQMGALLVAQGHPADAEKLLAPHEAAVRAALSGGDADMTGPWLMQLGMARAGLARFAAAETDLLAAQPVLVKVDGAKGRTTRKCIQALIGLYAAWNAAQPGKGHDTQAIEWKRRLDVLDATASAAGGK